MLKVENNNVRSKRAYNVTNILQMWNPAFAVLLPYLQEFLYLYYHSAYGHQTWQDGDLPLGAPSHKTI